MQQHEKIRKKRDFQPIRFPGPTNRARDPLAFLRSIANGAHIQYRSTDSHLTFPDPLFKEQWYLVSVFFFFFFLQLNGLWQIFIFFNACSLFEMIMIKYWINILKRVTRRPPTLNYHIIYSIFVVIVAQINFSCCCWFL